MNLPTSSDRAESVAVAYDLVKLSAENLATGETSKTEYLEAVRFYSATFSVYSFSKLADHLRELGFVSAAREVDARLAMSDKHREQQAKLGRLA